MSGLYPAHDVYTEQLRRLEDYVRLNPRSAYARFLLAYHYITIGYPENAAVQLQSVLVLHPDDRLAADLLALMRNDSDQQDQFAAVRSTDSDVIEVEGRWRVLRPDGEIDLTMQDDRRTPCRIVATAGPTAYPASNSAGVRPQIVETERGD